MKLIEKIIKFLSSPLELLGWLLLYGTIKSIIPYYLQKTSLIFSSALFQMLSENWEGIIAISAVILTGTQIYFYKKHNKLSVKPHLDNFATSIEKDGYLEYILYLNNNGLGPADIESFVVKYNDEIISTDNAQETQQIIRNKIAENYSCENYVGVYTKGSVLPTNEKNILLKIILPISSDEEMNNFTAFLDRFDLIIEYKSFYGEIFTISTETFKRVKKL